MRPLKIKDRCTKKKLKKCQEVARTYDKIQTAYAEVLDRDKNIEVIKNTSQNNHGYHSRQDAGSRKIRNILPMG